MKWLWIASVLLLTACGRAAVPEEKSVLQQTTAERLAVPAREALLMFANNCVPDKTLVFGYTMEQFTAKCVPVQKR